MNGSDAIGTATNEFQRADSAPFATKGDGILDSTDVVQTRRYQNGSNPLQSAGGPRTPGGKPDSSAEIDKSQTEAKSPEGAARQLRMENAAGSAGQTVPVNIRVDAVGDESEYGFILNYNSSVLTMPVIGAGNAGATVRSCNTATAGVINCSVGGFSNNKAGSSDPGIGEIGAGNNQILITVTFTIAMNAQPGTTPLTLSNINASSDAPQLFMPTATGGMVTILAPTAAPVSVGGRVFTATGSGISKARVTLTDTRGQIRQTLTNPFGYYRFDDIEVGQTVIISVQSKRFTFATQVVSVAEELTALDFIAEP